MSRFDPTRPRTVARRSARLSLVGLAVLLLAVAPVAAVASTADAQAGGGGPAADADAQAANETDRFDVDAEVLGRCGLDCRLVAANVTNLGDETAENASMTVRVSVRGRELWSESGDLGDVEANETVERSASLDVGPYGLYRIQRNDGRVAINATVEWDGGAETHVTRRRVL
ncbi:hypothetical protein [Halomicrobium salinisoli]|uniref:hypothetical protein n=1 Tax=Halomicrobium salinisoli TaxID=2878391 RepID=UPI001CF08AFE|nr:hypothetical protein [Halomicrobium salinisoli]